MIKYISERGNKMINFATVGTGWITDSFIQAAQLSGKFHLVGVHSRTEEKAKQMADKYQAANYLSYLPMQNSPRRFSAGQLAQIP